MALTVGIIQRALAVAVMQVRICAEFQQGPHEREVTAVCGCSQQDARFAAGDRFVGVSPSQEFGGALGLTEFDRIA